MSSYTELDTALLDLDFTNPRIQNYLQNQTLEHVFDALYAKYTNAKANDIIQTIIDSF